MDKVTSNAQFITNIVDVLKELSTNAILKNEKLADEMETIDSIRDGSVYIACIENSSTIDMFSEIPIEILKPMVPANDLMYYHKNPESIPVQYHERLLPKVTKHFIDNYEEKNNYFRMLSGLPDYNTDGYYFFTPINGVNISKPIHEMNINEINILERTGRLDTIRKDNPELKYLNYLGEKSISIYKARRSSNFELIYCPNVGTKDEQTKFMNLIERNRVYTIKTIYSDAFSLESEYYDNFISLFIVIQTVTDIIIDSPEVIIKREFYDEPTIRDTFLSHGIDYYSEIPIKYQLAMLKNLNQLLKFKSTNKNLVDICSIFGFDNIQIFKYYLLKDRKVDNQGMYTEPKYKLNSKNEYVEDDSQNYELKFIKVPIEGIADDYIRDKTNHTSYGDIVDSDKYWYANAPKEEVDNTILDNNFNYVISKYLSIDSIFDMSKLSFDMTYFINMVFDNKDLEDALTMFIPLLSPSHTFKLVDCICFMYVLMYEIMGVDDTILDTSVDVLHILGFDFGADVNAIINDLEEQGYTKEKLGIDISKFKKVESEILSYNELLSIYQNNKNIREELLKLMINTDNIHLYRIYNKLYKALMVTELNTSNFVDNKGMFTKTYTDFLKDRDDIMYNEILNIRNLEYRDKVSRANEIMEAVLAAMEEYVVSVDFDFFISNISTVSLELAQRYLFKVINFFKSYTVQMLSMNIVYSFNNKFENTIIIIDNIDMIKAVFTLITPYRHNIITDKVFFPDGKEIKLSTDTGIYDNILIYRN